MRSAIVINKEERRLIRKVEKLIDTGMVTEHAINVYFLSQVAKPSFLGNGKPGRGI
jgi:hypothetical protein